MIPATCPLLFVPRRQRWRAVPFKAVVLLALAMFCGCASPGRRSAIDHYYAGRLPAAREDLAEISETHRNAVLALMERGMVHQAAGEYTASIHDWLDARERIRELDYIRLSEQASSLVINERMQTYTGKPYERALLHAFTAKSFFAMAQWRSAAVEARLIAEGLENLNGFPDDPYTRYVAALAFELIRDFNGSRIEYTKADELLPALQIASDSGRITAAESPPPPAGPQAHELILFIGIGRAPVPHSLPLINQKWGSAPYAEILHDGKILGRSFTLNTTANLAAETEKRIAAIQAARTVTRLVIKDSIAHAISENNLLLGDIMRILLFALETPDTRAWETLPLWLQVARIPCPPDLEAFTVVFKTAAGHPLQTTRVTAPLTQTDGKSVSFIRVW